MSEIHFCSDCQNTDCPAEMPDPNAAACKKFVGTALTNGDVIRLMSNEELAGVIECPHFEGMCIHRDDEYPCKCCKRDWLNAPSESEVSK